jgi:hypothetical protein
MRVLTLCVAMLLTAAGAAKATVIIDPSTGR